MGDWAALGLALVPFLCAIAVIVLVMVGWPAWGWFFVTCGIFSAPGSLKLLAEIWNHGVHNDR